jgi:hypothetical protein
MDDLEELRGFRAEVPAHDGAAYAQARAALRGHMRRPAYGPRRWRLRLAVPAVAFAALAIVVAAAIGIGRAPDAANAASVLKDAAQKLQAVPAAPLTAGQYWYVEQTGRTLVGGAGADPAGYLASMAMVHKLWIGPDGSGRIVRTESDPVWVTPSDHDRWVAAGSPSLAGPTVDEKEPPGGLTFPFGSRTLTYAELRALPTDPAALGPMIAAAASVTDASSAAASQLELIGELLRSTPLAPAQSAALYKVAATLPGIELAGPTTDPIGRPGVGITITSNGYRQELVLDPDTGQLLGEIQTNLIDRPDMPAGTNVETVSYVRSGVVNSTTQIASP